MAEDFRAQMANKENNNPVYNRANEKTSRGFKNVMAGLERKQLLHDFQFGNAAILYDPKVKIGAGAFGMVCSAEEKKYGKRVAIKKISHATATPTSLRRTLREIRVMRYLDHPNIISMLDVFRTRGTLGEDIYIVMDLMDYTLHDLIHRKSSEKKLTLIEEELVLSYTMHILEGLQYLHKQCIAHRDLKPSNLLLNRDGAIKIADFGMAKFMGKEDNERRGVEDEQSDDFNYMTQNIATLPYRAPELLFTTQCLKVAIDIWSVGCIFVEMYTGQIAFPCHSVDTQIKIVLSLFGRPSDSVLDMIKCPKTRREAEAYESYSVEYLAFLYTKDRADLPNDLMVMLLSRMMVLDPRKRATVDELLQNSLFCNRSDREQRGSCPFRVKKDMCDIEKMSIEMLKRNILEDVSSADNTHSYDAWRIDAFTDRKNKELHEQTFNYESSYPTNRYTLNNYNHPFSNINNTRMV